MKVKKIEYAMLRVTKQFENDRATVEVELEPGNDPQAAFATAQAHCIEALQGSQPKLCEKIAKLMQTDRGRAKLQTFVDRAEQCY